MNFNIVFCHGCMATYCVPPRAMWDSALNHVDNCGWECGCRTPVGWYLMDGNPVGQVEVDLDDKFEADDNRVERMDVVVEGFP